MKKRIIIPIAVVLVVAIAVSVCLILNREPQIDENTVIGSVNGISVYYGELRDEMNRNKASVISEFSERFDADVSAEDFWNTEFEGVTPLQTLREQSAENVVRYKILQQKAVEYEVIKKDETSYSSFLQQLDEQNSKRSQKAQNDEVIYGASEYTKDTFYKYFASIIEIELISKLTDDGAIDCSDKNIKDYFDSIKDEQYKLPPIAEYELFSVNATEENAEKTMKEVLKIVKESADYKKKIKEEHPNVEFSKVSLNENTERSLQKENGIMYSAMIDLKECGISSVFQNNNSFGILKCLSYKSSGYKSYSENKDSVAMQYRQAEFDKLIDSLCEECTPKWNGFFNRVAIV